MVRNSHLPEQPALSFTVNKPKYTYGVRLYICPYCGRKQHMKPDDKKDATIKCTSCYESLKIVANTEIEDDLFDCRVDKISIV